jgi:hypothetical protein
MKKFIINSGKKFVSKVKNGPSRIKGRIDKTKKTFKDKLHEACQKPMSKRKLTLLGFSMILASFGITMLAPVLQAIAKDVPAPKPTDVAPAPIVNQKLRERLGVFAIAVCAGAATSGSFVLGAPFGIEL